MAIKHTFVSSKPDGVDTGLVQPSNWNASHDIENGTITGVMLAAGLADANYVHPQIGASASWVIVHNLNKYPAVVVVDSGGNVAIGDVVYNSVNQVTISFATAFSGSAYLN